MRPNPPPWFLFTVLFHIFQQGRHAIPGHQLADVLFSSTTERSSFLATNSYHAWQSKVYPFHLTHSRMPPQVDQYC
ncbi:hypothetical protein DFH07DRAFT_849400 [Mycena maculata]|uniref:Secreted protein n=1 Tax=Mycena maculata TaxID=230809 RepID=A0AAD7HWP6_9AGAR|nr:hypothetical protein DFH07DRAFT_849400 [Mycena maculata]